MKKTTVLKGFAIMMILGGFAIIWFGLSAKQ
jgi:hypothetical protein